MSKADLRINVGADVNASTEILKKDLKNIEKNLKINIIPQDKDKYWQNVFKEYVKSMTATNDELKKMKTHYKELEKASDSFLRKNINGIDLEIKKREEVAKRFSAQLKEQMKLEQSIQNRINKFTRNSEGFFRIQSNKAIQLGINPEDIESLKNARNLLTQIQSQNFRNQSLEQQVNILNQYEQALKDVVNQMRVLSSDKSLEKHHRSTAHQAQAHLAAVKNLTIQLQNYLKTNSRVLKNEKGQKLSNILQDLLGGKYDTDTAGFDEIRNTVKQLQIELKAAGLEGQTMWERIGKAYQKFGGWMLVTHSLMQLKRVFTKMIKNVKEIDLQMTELKKVTEETDATYKRFLEGAAERAKILGSTISDVVRATAEFAKMGYSLEESSKLADAALVYKNVGDGINNIEEASSTVISTMKAFGIEASKSMEIIDKFNEVSNNFAASSKDIGLAMADAGAALASSGNTIDESIAMFVAMNEIIQDASKSSTALRTLATRIRNTAGKLQEMGEDAEGAAESTTKLQQQIKELTGVDIMLNPDTFKSTYQIMLEISKVWDKLTDKAKADVIRLLGGTRQASTLSALLSNMSTAQKVVETSMNSMGSALAENEKYLDSIQGRLTKMNSAFQALSQTVVNSDFLKVLITGATGAINALDKIIQELGSLNVVIITTVASLAIFNEGFRAFYNANIASMFAGIAEVIQYKLVASLGLAKGAAIGLAQAFTVIAPIAILTGAIWLFKHLSEATERERQKIAELKQEYDNLNQSLEDNKNKLKEVEDRRKELYRLREEGIITQAEKDELDHLEKVNEELEKQIEYEEALQEIKGKKLEEEALKAGSRKTERSSYLRPDIVYEKITPAEKLQENITLIKQYQQQLEELKKSRDNNTISAEEYEKQEKKINDALKSLITESEELKNKLEEENEAYKGYTTEGDEKKALNLKIIKIYKELIVEINKETDAINKNTQRKKEQKDLMDYLIQTEEQYKTEVESLMSTLEDLEQIQDKVNDRYSFSYKEIEEIRKKYPELESAIYRTAKGWSIETSALEELRQKQIEQSTTQINAQIEMTKKAMENTKARLSYIKDEIEGVKNLADGYRVIANLYKKKGISSYEASSMGAFGSAKTYEDYLKNIGVDPKTALISAYLSSVKSIRNENDILTREEFNQLKQAEKDIKEYAEAQERLAKLSKELDDLLASIASGKVSGGSVDKEQSYKNEALEKYLRWVEHLKALDLLTTGEEITHLQYALRNLAKTQEEQWNLEERIWALRKQLTSEYLDYTDRLLDKNNDYAQYINDLQWALNNLTMTEQERENIQSKIEDAQAKRREKLINLVRAQHELEDLYRDRELRILEFELSRYEEGSKEWIENLQRQNQLLTDRQNMLHKENEQYRKLRKELKEGSEEYKRLQEIIVSNSKEWLSIEEQKLANIKKQREVELQIAEEGRDTLIDLYKAYYDKLKDMEEERHDEVIRNIDKEIKKLEEKYDKEDYREKLAKKNKEIAKKQAELEALALDNSMEGLAKKAKLEEELEELLDEKNEMVEKNKRDEMRKTLEKAKEAENEKYKANMKSLEERSKQEAIYAEVVQMLTNETTGHIIDKYNEMAKVVGGKWDEISEKAKNYAKIVQSATQYQNPESAIRQENLAESNKVVQFRRFVEGMGATVDWDEKTGAVLVNGKVIDTSKFELRSDDRYYAKIKDIIEALKKAKVPNLNFDDGGVIVNAHKKERVLTPIQNKNFERLVELANNPNFIKAIDFSKFLIPKMNIPAFASNIGKSISIGQVNLNIPALPTDTADEVVRQVEKRFKIWINDVLKN